MDYEHVFKRIYETCKLYINNKVAPSAAFRDIKEIVTLADTVQKASNDWSNARFDLTETKAAYEEAEKVHDAAKKAYINAHNELDEALGRYGEKQNFEVAQP